MREAAVTRVSADLCFFYLLFCLFSPTSPQIGLLCVFIAACIVSGILAQRGKTALIRFLASLPPLLLLLLSARPISTAALLAGWLYFALMLTLDRAGMEYWVYRRSFLIMAAAAIMICLLVSAALIFTVPIPAGVYTFAAAFTLLGLYTLRAMRMGVSTDFGWKLYSALELILPAALAGAAGALIYQLFRYAGSLLEYLFLPLGLLILFLSELFGTVFSAFKMDMGEQEITDTVPPEHFDSPSGGAAAAQESASGVGVWLREFSIPWKGIALALLLIAALVVLVLYLRRSKKTASVPSAVLTEQRFRLLRRRKNRPVSGNDAERIRQLYQEYLSLLQLHGREIRHSETSAEIALEGNPWEQQLRNLYLVARYGDSGSLCADDVEMAQDCLSRIRESL